MPRKATYTYAFYETRSDGRWYLVGRERETEPLYAVESFYGKLATPRTGDAYRLADGRSVRALLEVNEEDEQLDPYAGMSGRVRLPEHIAVSTPAYRGEARKDPAPRLPEGILVPADHRPSALDCLIARRELNRAGLGTYAGDLPMAPTAQTVSGIMRDTERREARPSRTVEGKRVGRLNRKLREARKVAEALEVAHVPATS